jgi:hypothetical protein
VWRIRGNVATPLYRANGLPSDKVFAIVDDGWARCG